MFYHVAGGLTHVEPGVAVVDCGGVGFRLTISRTTQDTLPLANEENPPRVRLFTWMSVREDAIELFGFATQEELSAFRLLIGVSGVGPKAAMAVLSVLNPSQLAVAVMTEDTRAISQAQNVGAKSAARIVLELKDKMKAPAVSSERPSAAGTASVPAGNGGKLSEAMNALLVLGYSRTEASNALRDLKTDSMELEEIIRAALARLAKF